MNPFAHSALGRAGAVIAGLAATGLLLSACGGNSPASSGNTSVGNSGSGSAPSSSPATSTSTNGTTSSGNSGTGSAIVSAASEPFPIALGNTWIYQADVAHLASAGTVTDKVVAVKPVSDGSQVTLSHHDSFASTTADSIFVFHPDGSITYPFSQDEGGATIVKGGVTWPPASVISSGQPTTSTVQLEIHPGASAAQRVNAHITVTGDGTATVTVPAGTYTATIVSMDEKFTVAGYTGQILVKTWMAAGIGPVQSEATLTELGHSQLVSELKLISFKHG